MRVTVLVVTQVVFCAASTAGFSKAKGGLATAAERVKSTVEINTIDLLNIVQGGTPVELITALARGGDVNFTDDTGMSLLHHAAELGRSDMAKILRRHGANENFTDDANRTPLQLAKEKERSQVIELLENDKSESEVGEKDDGCDNRLHIASLSGDLEAVSELLAGGLNVNAKDTLNRTALHYAALSGNVDIANLLLEHNADLGVEDNSGKTPMLAAQFAKKKSVVEVFERHTDYETETTPDSEQQISIAERRRRALAVRAENKYCTRNWDK